MRRQTTIILLSLIPALLLLTTLAEARGKPKPQPKADLVLFNGKVYTVDDSHTVAESIAIAGDEIVYVGDHTGLQEYLGNGTSYINLTGKLVLPGFVDSHAHPLSIGHAAEAHHVIADPFTTSGTISEIEAFVAAHPERAFFEFFGYAKSTFASETGSPPTKEILDAIESVRPIFVLDQFGHSAWVNSGALALAGITAATPDPDNGVIQRDENGEPNGQLLEDAMNLVLGALPLPQQQDIIQGFVNRQPYFNSQGVTAVHDMAAGRVVSRQKEYMKAGNAMAQNGQLTLRLNASWELNWTQGNPSAQLDDFFSISDSFPASDSFRARSIKFFIDGTLEEFTGLVLEPYECLNQTSLQLDCEPGGHGIDFWGGVESDLVSAFRKINRHGYQINAHTIGDAAVRKTVDALKKAKVNGKLRPSLEHIQMATDSDVQRMSAQGISLNASPYWMALDDFYALFYIPGIGFDRAYNDTYPLQSVVDAGVNVSAGSDGFLDVMFQVYTGMTRLYPPRIYSLWYCCFPAGVGGFMALYPYTPDLDAVFTLDDYDLEGNSVQPISVLPRAEERVGAIETMIEVITINGAKANLMEDIIGSLEVGKKADLVIMDTDILEAGNRFEISRDLNDLLPVANASVLLTVFDGRVVYDRGTGAVRQQPKPVPQSDIE